MNNSFDRNAPPEFNEALGELRKALYLYQMNEHKETVKQATKDRLRDAVIVAASKMSGATL